MAYITLVSEADTLYLRRVIQTPVANQLGRQLAGARVAAGLSLTAASERSGVARTTLHLIEKSERHPNIRQLEALASAYDVSVAELWRRAEAAATLRDGSTAEVVERG